MIYRHLPNGRLRSYKNLGNWGIGCNIDDIKRGFRASIDICYGNSITTIATADFGSVPTAKMWLTKYMKKLIGEIERWID